MISVSGCVREKHEHKKLKTVEYGSCQILIFQKSKFRHVHG